MHAKKTSRPWLAIYAWVLTLLIFMLVVMGGNVTSTDAGMAFEDWPTSAGHNMLLTPIDVWWATQDKFAEHSHRLMGALVGFLSIGLVAWLWIGYARLGRRWRRVCLLGTILLVLVVIQGVLGGLRVNDRSQLFAFFHGILGQIVLATSVAIASLTSRSQLLNPTDHLISPGEENHRRGRSTDQSVSGSTSKVESNPTASGPPHVRRFAWMIVAIFIVQLILGSGVRHSGSAVAVPDFPTTYGHLLPPFSQAALNKAELARGLPADPSMPNHYALWQVWLHFSHRLGAVGLCIITAIALCKLFARLDWSEELIGPTIIIVSLLVIQVILGMVTVLTKERPSVATLHQTVGAALLAAVTWLTVRVYFARRESWLINQPRPKGSGP